MTLRPRYPVSTSRLLLRPLTEEDAGAIVAYRSLPEVCRYVPFERMTVDDVREKLAGPWARTVLEDEQQTLTLGVETQATGEVIGDVMLHWGSRVHRSGEIGYVFHPQHAGRGYATEAMAGVLRMAFDDLELHRVVARIDALNEPSARLAERLGMRREARLVENEWFKGRWSDELVYAILDREWRSRA